MINSILCVILGYLAGSIATAVLVCRLLNLPDPRHTGSGNPGATNVLRFGGLDPDEYQGFAWGMGIDRIAMLKYGMPDLRDFFDADVRWLSHYGFRPLDMPTLFGGLST